MCVCVCHVKGYVPTSIYIHYSECICLRLFSEFLYTPVSGTLFAHTCEQINFRQVRVHALAVTGKSG